MTQPAEQTIRSPVSYISLVRLNRGFRSLWFGQIISLFGDWFNLIASASLISSLTGSGMAVGGLFVVRMLAPFLVSPLAGVAADRFNRKHLLVLTDLSRAAVVLGFLLVREASQVWLLYALTAIQLSLSGFFFPTRNAILPDIVSRGELGAANTLSSATWSVMLAVGAALGGVVAGEWGIYPAFAVDSASFVLSAFFILQIKYEHDPHELSQGRSLHLFTRQYIEGIRYLRENRDILAISLQKAAVALSVSGAFQVVQVALAEQVFVIGEGGGTSLGLLYAVGGVGTGLGPILARRFTGDREHSLRIAILIAYGVSSIGLIISAPLWNFPILLLGTLIRAVGGGINWVFTTQLLLQLLPDRVRGRVFSTEFAFLTLANAIGAALGGWAFDSLGMDSSDLLWWMAALVLVPGILWLAWITTRRKRSQQTGKISEGGTGS